MRKLLNSTLTAALVLCLTIDPAIAGWLTKRSGCRPAPRPAACVPACQPACKPVCCEPVCCEPAPCSAPCETPAEVVHVAPANCSCGSAIVTESHGQPVHHAVIESSPVETHSESTEFKPAPNEIYDVAPVPTPAAPEGSGTRSVEPAQALESMPEDPEPTEEPESTELPPAPADLEPADKPADDLFGSDEPDPMPEPSPMPQPEAAEPAPASDDIFGDMPEAPAEETETESLFGEEPEEMPEEPEEETTEETPAAPADDLFGEEPAAEAPADDLFGEDAPAEEAPAPADDMPAGDDGLFGEAMEELAEEPAEAPATDAPVTDAPAEDDLFGDAPETPMPADEPAEQPPAEDDGFGGLFGDEPVEDAPMEEAPPAEEPEEAPADEPEDDSNEADAFEDLFGQNERVLRLDGGLQSNNLRTWTDNTGRYQCQARLLVLLDGKVRLLKDNGRTSTVALYRLSKGDLDFVNVQAAAQQNSVVTQTASR